MRIDEMEKLPIEHPDHVCTTTCKHAPTPDNFLSDTEEEVFKVGQKVVITGGKHKKLVKEGEVCIIQEVRKTFLVVQVSGAECPAGRSIQCHRKFVTSFKEELPEPELETPPETEGGTMPSVTENCVVVERLPEETPDESGETPVTPVNETINEVVRETVTGVEEEHSLSKDDEIARLKGIISDLEGDILSYRDMMLGHQNELEYLRKETGPTQEEKKVKNEKLIDCIKILLSLQ